MRKTLKWFLLTLLGAAVLLAAAVPFAVPPLVEEALSRVIASLGLRPDVRMRLGYCWRNGPGIDGSLRLLVDGSPWCLQTRFGASCCEWSADATIAETAFSESDPLAKAAFGKWPLPASVSNLVFSGSLSLAAHAERTFRRPVPVWRVKVPVKGLTADLTLEGQPYSVSGLTLTAGASGIADHLDISPVFLRAASLQVNNVVCSNLTAAIRASEKALMINEASAGFCGGKVSLYSLFLNPKSLNAGFTLFLEDVDAGQALRHLKGFRGDASGRLHGKTRLFVREGGKAIRLNDTFLYSTPGEPGKLRMENPERVTENLAFAGIEERARANVADALTDLDYSALRLNLTRLQGDDATLSAHVEGTATRGDVTVPVNLTVNFHGELEQLVNTGLGLSSKLKGKKP